MLKLIDIGDYDEIILLFSRGSSRLIIVIGIVFIMSKVVFLLERFEMDVFKINNGNFCIFKSFYNVLRMDEVLVFIRLNFVLLGRIWYDFDDNVRNGLV